MHFDDNLNFVKIIAPVDKITHNQSQNMFAANFECQNVRDQQKIVCFLLYFFKSNNSFPGILLQEFCSELGMYRF